MWWRARWCDAAAMLLSGGRRYKGTGSIDESANFSCVKHLSSRIPSWSDETGSAATVHSNGDTVSKFWFDGYSDPNPPIYPPGGPASGTTPPGTMAAGAPTAIRA